MTDSKAHVVPGKAKPLGAYPHLRIVGDLVFVSGTSSRQADDSIAGATVGDDGAVTLDIRAQTRAVLANIADILGSVELGLDDVVDITSFLVSMDDFAGYNEAYGEVFGGDGPARTTVAVRALPHPQLLVEMKAIARIP